MTIRKRNIAGFYDGNGQFRPIRSPQYVGTPKRKARTIDKKKYSRAKAGDLGEKRQTLALEDVFDKAIRLDRKANEKAERLRKKEFREIERDVYGTKQTGRLSQTLMQFVRASGGIRRTYRHGGKKAFGRKSSYDAGEINRVGYKETGRRGLTTDKGGKTLDYMFQAAREAGYDVADIDDMMSRIEDEASGGKPTYATHGYLDYRDNPKKRNGVLIGDTDKKDMKSDLYINRIGTRKFAVYLKTYLLKTFATLAAAEAYLRSIKARSKKNPPSASRLAKSAIAVFDADLDLDLDVADVNKLRAGEKQLRRRKTTAAVSTPKRPARKNPVGTIVGVVNRFTLVKRRDTKGRIAYSIVSPKGIEVARPRSLASGRKRLEVIATKKNPLDPISTFANAAVGIASALQIKEHMNRTRKPTRKRRGATTAQTKKRAKNPVSATVKFHEQEFDRLLAAIEEGKFTYIRSAKLKGRLAGYSPREVEHLIYRSRMAANLKKNPTTKLIAETTKLVKNGVFKRLLARHKAASAFRKELRLEHALEKARAKKEKAKAAAKRNPTRRKRNVEMGFRSGGTFHPIRASHDYDYDAVGEKSPGVSSRLHSAAQAIRKRKKANPQSAIHNPKSKVPHRRTYSMFQGRPATKANAMPVSRHAPARLDQLGDLIELKLTNGQVLKVNPKRFKLCASAGRLWIAGGKFAKANPAEKANVLNPVAEIAHVVYGTHKPHHGDNNYTHYIHRLGEVSGKRPILAVDREGFPVIRGGNYKIEARGIVD